MNIKAVIVKKYVDSKNHATKMIILSEQDVSFEIAFEDRYTDGFWEFIQPKDSMVKRRGSLDVIIKRGEKEYNYTFNCSFN